MQKPSRNDPCPCGSGQKYKKCCESKKAAPRKFTAQLLSGSASTQKIQGVSRLFQPPTTPISLASKTILEKKNDSLL